MGSSPISSTAKVLLRVGIVTLLPRGVRGPCPLRAQTGRFLAVSGGHCGVVPEAFEEVDDGGVLAVDDVLVAERGGSGVVPDACHEGLEAGAACGGEGGGGVVGSRGAAPPARRPSRRLIQRRYPGPVLRWGRSRCPYLMNGIRRSAAGVDEAEVEGGSAAHRVECPEVDLGEKVGVQVGLHDPQFGHRVRHRCCSGERDDPWAVGPPQRPQLCVEVLGPLRAGSGDTVDRRVDPPVLVGVTLVTL